MTNTISCWFYQLMFCGYSTSPFNSKMCYLTIVITVLTALLGSTIILVVCFHRRLLFNPIPVVALHLMPKRLHCWENPMEALEERHHNDVEELQQRYTIKLWLLRSGRFQSGGGWGTRLSSAEPAGWHDDCGSPLTLWSSLTPVWLFVIPILVRSIRGEMG